MIINIEFENIGHDIIDLIIYSIDQEVFFPVYNSSLQYIITVFV